MSDITLQTTGVVDYKIVKLSPAFLIVVEEKKTLRNFIAIKFDETHNCAKAVGFYHSGDMDDIINKYPEIIKSTDPSSFVEIMFPWNKIQYVRSLVYKHKTGEKK